MVSRGRVASSYKPFFLVVVDEMSSALWALPLKIGDFDAAGWTAPAPLLLIQPSVRSFFLDNLKVDRCQPVIGKPRVLSELLQVLLTRILGTLVAELDASVPGALHKRT
jgi:hypothetical protein